MCCATMSSYFRRDSVLCPGEKGNICVARAVNDAVRQDGEASGFALCDDSLSIRKSEW